MGLIIKGAHYHDVDADEIVIPEMSGEFYIVDCTRYVLKNDLEERYDEDFIEKVIEDNNTIEYEGNTYYYSESSPVSVGEFDLLSDLSDLSHIEQDFY